MATKSEVLGKIEAEERKKYRKIITVTKKGEQIEVLVRKGKKGVNIDEVITAQFNYEKGKEEALAQVRQEIEEHERWLQQVKRDLQECYSVFEVLKDKEQLNSVIERIRLCEMIELKEEIVSMRTKVEDLNVRLMKLESKM